MKALQRMSSSAIGSLAKLSQKKYRREAGAYLVEGPHLVGEAIAAGAGVETILVTEESSAKPEIAGLIRKAGSTRIPVYLLSAREMERLSDAVTSQGILGVVALQEASIEDFWGSRSAEAIVIALEHVADPGNVGAILRTSDWFGAAGVLLSHGCVELHNPKVIRATMGALFRLPAFEELDLASSLRAAKNNGYSVVVTSLEGGKPFDRRKIPARSVIVLGSEADGVTKGVLALADMVVTIPRFGHGESLNVAATCAAVLGSLRLP
jgi:TrmH family RNA methyltransferase